MTFLKHKAYKSFCLKNIEQPQKNIAIRYKKLSPKAILLYSKIPPITTPSKFVPNAAAVFVTFLKESEKIKLAKKIGIPNQIAVRSTRAGKGNPRIN